MLFFAFWLLFHSFSEEFVEQNGFFDHVASTFCNTNFSNVSIFLIQFFFHAAKQKPTFIFQQYFGFACATINPLGNPQKYQFIKMKYFMDTILQMKTIQKEKQTKPQNRYIKNVIWLSSILLGMTFASEMELRLNVCNKRNGFEICWIKSHIIQIKRLRLVAKVLSYKQKCQMWKCTPNKLCTESGESFSNGMCVCLCVYMF